MVVENEKEEEEATLIICFFSTHQRIKVHVLGIG
jgi:hypothetical protein